MSYLITLIRKLIHEQEEKVGAKQPTLSKSECRTEMINQNQETNMNTEIRQKGNFGQGGASWQEWCNNVCIKLVKEITEWHKVIHQVKTVGRCGFDLETTGLDPYSNTIATLQIAVPTAGEPTMYQSEQFALPNKHNSATAYVLELKQFSDTDIKEILQDLEELIADKEVVTIGHNITFDLKMLRAATGNRLIPKSTFDTMLASQLINAGDFIPGNQIEKWCEENMVTIQNGEQGKVVYLDCHGHTLEFEKNNSKYTVPYHLKHRLSDLAHRHLEILLDKSWQTTKWDGELTPEQIQYAAIDSLVLLPLYEILAELILFNDLKSTMKTEMACLPSTVEIELMGMPFDSYRATKLLQKETTRLEKCSEKLLEHMSNPGKPKKTGTAVNFNPNSSKQVVDYLKKLATHEGVLGEDGNSLNLTSANEELVLELSSKEEVLSRVAARLPEGSRMKSFISSLIEYRKHKKKIEFLKSSLEYVHPSTYRIHSSLRALNPQAVGRFTASKPNMQQVPRDHDLRSLFKPESGNKFIVADYSAIEMRIMCELSQDETLKHAFFNHIDVHKYTAAGIMKKSLDEVTKDERNQAKALNFVRRPPLNRQVKHKDYFDLLMIA